MADDDPIMSAYSYAKRESVREGFVPVLIQADDETLLECLVMNADPEHDADFYEFDLKTVAEYRKKMLSAPVKDGNPNCSTQKTPLAPLKTVQNLLTTSKCSPMILHRPTKK